MKNQQKIAFLVEDGTDDTEFWCPYYRLQEAGIDVVIVSPDGKQKPGKYGRVVKPDLSISKALKIKFDGVYIPGGMKGAELLRMNPSVISFVQKLYSSNKMVAAICHGPWVLISAGITKNKMMTCYRGMKDDLIATSAYYTDESVMVDKNIITARTPRDLPAFHKAMLAFIKKRSLPC